MLCYFMLCYFVSEDISAQFLVTLPKILNMDYPLKIVIIIIIHMSEKYMDDLINLLSTVNTQFDQTQTKKMNKRMTKPPK